MRDFLLIMLGGAIGWSTLFAFTLNKPDPLPPQETFSVVFEPDCYIEYDGEEVKVLRVDMLKLEEM